MDVALSLLPVYRTSTTACCVLESSNSDTSTGHRLPITMPSNLGPRPRGDDQAFLRRPPATGALDRRP